MKMLSVLITVFLCGCSTERTSGLPEIGVPTPVPVSKSRRAEPMGPKEALALWASSRVVNYEMTISLDTTSYLEPARVVLVKVRNGSAVSVEVPDKSDGRGRLSFYDSFLTVEKMFAEIESLRRTGSVTVRYNESYGYPEEIEYFKPTPDTPFTFRVLRFQPLARDE